MTDERPEALLASSIPSVGYTIKNAYNGITEGLEMSDALKTQVGGSHYVNMKIQPVEFITKNRIGFIEGNIIKYICRWRAKNNGIDDLRKVRHYIDLLIQLESDETPD